MSDPYKTICSLGRDIDRLMEDLDEAIKRADAAEAEVARLKEELRAADRAYDDLKASLAKRPPEPYTPKVGDVVTFWNGCVGIIKRLREGERAWRVENKATGDWWEGWVYNDLRPATPAERAAAGLPAEAHAKPEVLPEHLALLEASAAYWSTYGMGEDKWERMIQAGKDLLAAVARRDGGAK